MLTTAEQETFCAIADILIPAFAEMPAFSQSGAPLQPLNRVLELRPELQAPLRTALSHVQAHENAADAADRLNKEQPDAIGLIGLVASSAYYLVPDIREKLGYPGQLQRPPSDDEAYDYEALLQPVIDRGSIFRPTPK